MKRLRCQVDEDQRQPPVPQLSLFSTAKLLVYPHSKHSKESSFGPEHPPDLWSVSSMLL